MSQEIQRQLFDLYNPTDRPIPLVIKSTSSTEIINNSQDYNVCVEKLEIPINNGFMPINSNDFDYNICIFNEYKAEDRTFTNLSYASNYFSFKGPFYSVDEFLKKVNDIILKKAQPEVTLGSIERKSGDDEMFAYVYDRQFANEHNMLKIYFDAKLMKLFKFNYKLDDVIQHNGSEYFRFYAVDNFTSTSTTTITQVDAKENTFANFFNLKSIRVYSNLPTTATKVFDIANRVVVDSDMLTDVTFNTATSYNLKNLIYIPNQFRLSSMENGGAIRDVELRFYYYYANGREYAVYLDSLEYASASLSYVKKSMNDIF